MRSPDFTSRHVQNRSRFSSLSMLTLGLVLTLLPLGCAPDAAEDPDPALSCTADKVRGMRTQYVTNSIFLPTSARDKRRADYDGDGRVENQLRLLIQIANVGGIDVQGPIDQSITSGNGLVLLELIAPDRMNADCASLSLMRAKQRHPALPPPNYSGEDWFELAESPRVTLYGTIQDGVFHSVRPASQPAMDNRFEIVLHIGQGEVVWLPLRGVSIEAQLQETPQGPAILGGQLYSVLTEENVRNEVAPAIARLLNKIVNAGPDLPSVEGIIKIVESQENEASVKKCQVAADCCRSSHKTCKILTEEILSSAIGTSLASDVRVFDDLGNWHPEPGAKTRNGYSFGLQFHAVTATF